MKSMQQNLKSISDALKSTSGKVFHYRRPKDPGDSWVVWAEDGEGESMAANNRKIEQQIHGTIDAYTKLEYDPLIDEIQNALNEKQNVGWSLLSVQYEDETNLIHYEWEFYVS